MSKRPFLAMGLFAFLSSLLFKMLPLTAAVIGTLIALVAVIGAVLLRRCRAAKAVAFACVGVLLVGISLTITYVTEVYPQLAYDGVHAHLRVRVIEQVADRLYLVKTEAGDLPDGIRLTLPIYSDGIVPKAGDVLLCDVSLEAVTTDYAKANGAYLQATSDTLTWVDGAATVSASDAMLYSWRDAIHNTWYRFMEYDSAALCDTITIGMRTNLDAVRNDDFRTAGVYHMLCVSGLHLSVLAGAVLQFLKTVCRCRPRRAALLTMMTVVLYAAVCGFTASVMRAALMMLLMLASTMFRRRAEGLNSLGLAATVLLVIDPFAVYDLGFLLTFVSTFGILLWVPVWNKVVTERLAQRFPTMSAVIRPLVGAVGVSVSATVWVQPILSLSFGEASTYFLVGNLLCMYPATALLMLSAVALLFAFWCAPFAQGILMLCEWLCRMLSSCAAMIADWPLSTVSSASPFVIVWQLMVPIGITIGYVFRKRFGVMVSLMLLVTALCVHWLVSCFAVGDTVRVIPLPCDSLSVAVVTADSTGWIFEGDGDAAATADDAMRREGITSLDWVVWLNAPSVQSVDLSRMTLPITRVLTLGDPMAYTSLPSAHETVMLGENRTVSLFDQASLYRSDGWTILSVRGTVLLMSSETADATVLDESLLCPDAVFFSEAVPRNAERLSARQAVMFCDAYYQKELSATNALTVWFSGDEPPALMIDTNGEITLRSG